MCDNDTNTVNSGTLKAVMSADPAGKSSVYIAMFIHLYKKYGRYFKVLSRALDCRVSSKDKKDGK